MFFFEGPKVLFKVALAILNLCFASPRIQKETSGFFELTRKLRNLPIEVTHEETLIQEVSPWQGLQFTQLLRDCNTLALYSSEVFQ